MKKLYRKGQVHPSPSSISPTLDQFCLSFLPTTILTLATTLSSQEKEVLAYLLSCSSNTLFDFDPSNNNNNKSYSKTNPNKINNNQTHPPSFSCYCFTCYTYYWALWDSSPNRQLIHEIIDAFEDNLVSQNKKKKNGLSRREKRKNKGVLNLDETNNNNNNNNMKKNLGIKVDDHHHGVNGLVRVNPEFDRVDSVEEVDEKTGEKQGSHVRKIVSFIGERIWGSVWGKNED